MRDQITRVVPLGETPGVFFNNAIARGMTPPSHATMSVHFILEPKDKVLVLRIYMDLSKHELLERCLAGRTQNPNEFLHSKIWTTLSKTKFVARKTVNYQGSLTILQHNFGYKSTSMMLSSALTAASPHYIHTMDLKDRTRKRSASHPKQRATKRRILDDKDYAPGAF